MRYKVSSEEWDKRVELAAFYRAIDYFGMTDIIYNHITARVPGEPDSILLNPFGLLYSEVTASSLYKISVKTGEVILKPDSQFGLNRAAYIIHSAVHSGRHDVDCVVHTHTRAGVAVSTMACGLLPISQTAVWFGNAISYHDYEGPAFSLEERDRLLRDLGENNAMVLRNHGLLVCGKTISDAFLDIYMLEMACKIQVDALASGKEITVLSNDLVGHSYELSKKARSSDIEWGAIKRALDKRDTSYRD
jgi:ribulose-5-phosphate 4-epimerase/fuculose-1-phosphate aldolase